MDWLPHITSFDIIIFVIFLALIVRGFWIGFVRQIAFIVALALGFIIAGRYYGNFHQYIKPVIDDTQVAFIVSYVVLFAGIYSLIILLGLGLRMVMDVVLLGWFDRIIGGIIGATKALFISSLLFMALSGFLSSSNNFLRRSLTYPYLLRSAEYILRFIKDHNLRYRFMLKEPAIRPEPPAKQKKDTSNDQVIQKSGNLL